MNTANTFRFGVGQRFRVNLTTCGNPDFGQAPEQPLPDIPSHFGYADTIDEISAMCKRYISVYGVGFGSWAGGEVFETASNTYKGRISYGGKFFDENSEYGRWDAMLH